MNFIKSIKASTSVLEISGYTPKHQRTITNHKIEFLILHPERRYKQGGYIDENQQLVGLIISRQIPK